MRGRLVEGPGDLEAEESSLESDHRFNAMYMIYAQDPQQDLPLGYIYSIHLVSTQHNHKKIKMCKLKRERFSKPPILAG